jgi:hypothetical protein
VPIARSVDRTDRLLITSVTGVVTLSDIEAHLNVVFRLGLQPCPELIDARLVDQERITVRQLIGALGHLQLGREPFAPRAFVVASDAHFELVRVLASLVVGWARVGAFEEPAAARRWLLHPMSAADEAAWRVSLTHGALRHLPETA